MKHGSRFTRGFALIELLVVIAIIAHFAVTPLVSRFPLGND
jgi:prepilin-type N-terminal cleavage/methylation domain-containing protein